MDRLGLPYANGFSGVINGASIRRRFAMPWPNSSI